MTPSHIGRYEIQRRLGAGGMGSLYLARDPSLDRLVAIKLLKEDFQDDPELRERFVREARSVARLRHPNIVIVHDVGEDEGRPFMAMEYIAGETLTQVLRRRPSPPIVKRLAMVEDLCAGLAHAHGAGIIHRDIKPGNIMLDGEGVLKILDFGIARLGNSGMTQEGMMMGTVNYMSPEQVAGRGVDHRTDIFATGAVLYEMITLEQAFPGRIDTGVLNRLLNEGPVPLEQHVPGVDRELAGIVAKALDPEPSRRYQDANVMRLDLARVRRRLTEEGESDLAASRDTTIVEPPKSSRPRTGPKVESDRPRRLTPERFAELRRQQVEEHLRFGEEAFARGDHDAALHHAERAATVDPDSHAAIELIDKARLAIEAKAIRQLLAEAHRLLADGHLDDAAALAEEASVTVPDIHGAAELRREVRQTAEKIAAARERERRITGSLDRARSSIDRGGFETALRAVYEVLALDPERPEARALEQEAKSRLQAQREHERARRVAYEELARGRALAGEGKYDEAEEAINAVSAPSDTVRIAAIDALRVVSKARRQAAQAAIVAKAQAAFDDGRFDEAQAAIDTIPAEEQTPGARALREAAAKALHEQRVLQQKRQALESAIGAVQASIEEGSLSRAFERLEEAAGIGIDDERIAALRQRIADLVAAAEEKRRQEARDRVAAKRVEAARQLLANGDGYAAVALLERDGSGHPAVEQALREIRAAVAELEERVRKEAERRRHEEEARRRAETEAARRLEEERRAEEQRRRLEEERRRREAERQRYREEVATLLVGAEQALAADRPDEATLLLKRADEHVGAVEDTDLQRRVAAAKAEADRRERRRQEEIRKREEEARQREQALTEILTKVRVTAEHDVALGLLNEALTLAPADGRVQELVRERRAALERQRAEAERRQQEARRREEERRAREEEARRQAEAEAARVREEQRKAAERQRREEEQRRLRQEVERLIAAAEQSLGAGRLDEAAGFLTQAEAVRLPQRDAELERRLAAAKTDVARRREDARKREEEARRRQEQARKREEEARRREAALDELLTRARGEGAHEAALTLLSQAETLAPADPRVQTLMAERRSALEAQREEQRRQEEARKREEEIRRREEALTRILERAREERAHEAALTLLDQAETLAPGDPRVQTLVNARSAALEQERAAAAARAAEEAARRERERLAQQERDGQATRVVEQARALFASGRHEEAVTLLRASPAHALTQSAIDELESRRLEIERERQREALRLQRQQRRAAAVASLRHAAGDRRVQLSAVAVLFLALVWGGSRYWPAQAPSMDQPSSEPSATGAAPGGTESPPVAPPTDAPPVAELGGAATPADPGASASRAPAPGASGGARGEAPRPTDVAGGRTGRQSQPPSPRPPETGGTQAVGPRQPEPEVSVAQPSPPQASPQPSTPQPRPVPSPGPSPAPPPALPAPPPPAVPQIDLAAERASIQRLLAQYVDAYNRMDEARLKGIDPGFDGIANRVLLKSVELRLSDVTIDVAPNGQSATLRAAQSFSYAWNRSNLPRTGSGNLTWNLRKLADGWRVVP